MERRSPSPTPTSQVPPLPDRRSNTTRFVYRPSQVRLVCCWVSCKIVTESVFGVSLIGGTTRCKLAWRRSSCSRLGLQFQRLRCGAHLTPPARLSVLVNVRAQLELRKSFLPVLQFHLVEESALPVPISQLYQHIGASFIQALNPIFLVQVDGESVSHATAINSFARRSIDCLLYTLHGRQDKYQDGFHAVTTDASLRFCACDSKM